MSETDTEDRGTLITFMIITSEREIASDAYAHDMLWWHSEIRMCVIMRKHAQ